MRSGRRLVKSWSNYNSTGSFRNCKWHLHSTGVPSQTIKILHHESILLLGLLAERDKDLRKTKIGQGRRTWPMDTSVDDGIQTGACRMFDRTGLGFKVLGCSFFRRAGNSNADLRSCHRDNLWSGSSHSAAPGISVCAAPKTLTKNFQYNENENKVHATRAVQEADH